MKRLKVTLDVAATAAILAVAIVLGVKLVMQRGVVAANPRVEEIETVDVTLGSAPSHGEDAAGVALVMFSDFQCPFCRDFAVQTLPAIQQRYVESRKVRLEFKHFPLESLHPNARRAAVLAACASKQGRFWPAHDFLFKEVGRLANVDDDDFVASIGAVSTHFRSCLDSATGTSAVNSDLSQARSLRVSSTPVFFAGRQSNGVLRATWRITGAQPLSTFKEVLDGLLVAPR